MRTVMWVAMGALLTIGGVAQAADDGDYAPALRRMISETSAGRCPADVMADPLLAACKEQLPVMGPGLAKLGAIAAVTFIKAEDREGARIETYAVKHAGGKTMIWSLGNRVDGKFKIAYTLDQ